MLSEQNRTQKRVKCFFSAFDLVGVCVCVCDAVGGGGGVGGLHFGTDSVNAPLSYKLNFAVRCAFGSHAATAAAATAITPSQTRRRSI